MRLNETTYDVDKLNFIDYETPDLHNFNLIELSRIKNKYHQLYHSQPENVQAVKNLNCILTKKQVDAVLGYGLFDDLIMSFFMNYIINYQRLIDNLERKLNLAYFFIFNYNDVDSFNQDYEIQSQLLQQTVYTQTQPISHKFIVILFHYPDYWEMIVHNKLENIFYSYLSEPKITREETHQSDHGDLIFYILFKLIILNQTDLILSISEKKNARLKCQWIIISHLIELQPYVSNRPRLLENREKKMKEEEEKRKEDEARKKLETELAQKQIDESQAEIKLLQSERERQQEERKLQELEKLKEKQRKEQIYKWFVGFNQISRDNEDDERNTPQDFYHLLVGLPNSSMLEAKFQRSKDYEYRFSENNLNSNILRNQSFRMSSKNTSLPPISNSKEDITLLNNNNSKKKIIEPQTFSLKNLSQLRKQQMEQFQKPIQITEELQKRNEYRQIFRQQVGLFNQSFKQ